MTETTAATIRIALSAGHRNTDGGNATEMIYTARWTPAIAAVLRARGFDVRVPQPNDGAGIFPGGLAAVAQQVVTWANQGWRAHVFMEIHGESIAARGVFAIYPDWGTDIDVIVRDTLGPALARQVRGTTGLPLRNGSGIMSERQTGVGISGSRLGIFKITQSLKTMRRLIVECGSYGSPADKAIMDRPDFPQKLAAGIADALAGYFGVTTTPPQADRAVIGVQPSLTVEQWRDFLHRHAARLDANETAESFRFASVLEVDPAFAGAVWVHEGGSLPIGGSALQQQTNMPLNVKVPNVEWPGRRTVVANGSRWMWAESQFLGLLYSIWHLKNYHGAAGRTTVRQIIPAHAPQSDGNDPEAFIASVLEDMAYMRTH